MGKFQPLLEYVLEKESLEINPLTQRVKILRKTEVCWRSDYVINTLIVVEKTQLSLGRWINGLYHWIKTNCVINVSKKYLRFHLL